MNLEPDIGGCGCGQAQLTVHGEPLARFYCHCTTCQEAFRAPCSDVTVLLAADVALLSEGAVRFSSDGRPPDQNRGVCKACGEPVVGFVRGLPFVEFAVVPTHVLPAGMARVPSQGHIRYADRVDDVEDGLPTYEGAYDSEAAVLQMLSDALGPRMYVGEPPAEL